MFLVDVRQTDFYTFYYNVQKAIDQGINYHVRQVIGADNESKLPKNISADNARMGSYDLSSGKVVDIQDHYLMDGISASVNKELAEEILERAKYYCPVDEGTLRDSGHIEQDGDSYKIVFDTPYAWYVHEFSWRQHEYPTCDHFLTRAIYEIEKEHGFGWA